MSIQQLGRKLLGSATAVDSMDAPPGHRARAARHDETARRFTSIRRATRRYPRLHANASAHAAELENRINAGHRLAKWIGPLDPTMLSFLTMILASMLPAFSLEATGTRPGLSLFSVSLGGETLTTISALGLGLVFTLAGHGVGQLCAKAVHASGSTRGALLAGAAALLIATLVAIGGVGHDRSNNLQAKELDAGAALLYEDADDLERRARGADRRVAASAAAQTPSSPDGERMRREAEAAREQAARLESESRDRRSLEAFTAAQYAALGLSTLGGFVFGMTGLLRLRRRFYRLSGKVLAMRNTVRLKLDSLVALSALSVAVAGIDTIGDEEAYVDHLMERYFGPEPQWPDFEALLHPKADHDDDDGLSIVTGGRR